MIKKRNIDKFIIFIMDKNLKRSYKNGELDGHQTYYNPEGSLVAEGDYKNGRRIEDQQRK